MNGSMFYILYRIGVYLEQTFVIMKELVKTEGCIGAYHWYSGEKCECSPLKIGTGTFKMRKNKKGEI